MAYVAISNQLLHDVASQIDKLKDLERQTLKPPVNEMRVAPDDPQAMALIWGDYMHLKDQMPDTWKTQTAKVTMQYRVQMEHDYNTAYFQLICNSDSGFITPRVQGYTSYGLDVTYKEESDCPPIMAEILEYTKQVTEVDSRWKGIRGQVKDFLNNCKSLNEALKLWPDLRIYIPPRYIERMEANSPSAKKNAQESAALKALQSIDTDFVVAAAVGARMASAAAGNNS